MSRRLAPSLYSTPFDIKMPKWRRLATRPVSPSWLLREQMHEAWALAPRNELHVVTDDSSEYDRRCLEAVATYFRREFHYDFVQYSATETDVRALGFVWVSPGGGWVTGGACFRWREYLDSTPAYAMQWIWLHPYVRRSGLLSRAWPFFRARCGPFTCEPPLSPAMDGFLNKLRST